MRASLDYAESFQIAVRAIRANKARGVLTTLGIIIGIVAVVVTMTAANGLQTSFARVSPPSAATCFYVSRMPWVVMNTSSRSATARTWICARRGISNVARPRIVNPTMNDRMDEVSRPGHGGVLVIGTSDKQMILSSARPELGRFFMAYEVEYKKDVALIGSDVRKGVFGNGGPDQQDAPRRPDQLRVIGSWRSRAGPSWAARISTGRYSCRSRPS
jgi:putative ABC transport system permease protein